jgi:hypothetical protein
MTFGDAIAEMQFDKKVRRDGWDRDQFIFLVPGSTFKVNRPPLSTIYPLGTEIEYLPHIDLRRNDDETIEVWTAPHVDLVAIDWRIVPG